MLIHLFRYTCPFLRNHPSLLLSSCNNLQKSVIGGDKVLFGSKKRKSRINGVEKEKESEFETDKEKAREALRKLDQQLQSLSTKQVTPPKIRAEGMQSSYGGEDEILEISGSFWGYAASFLLLFTVFYNILFATVIKPSIDGPEPLESTKILTKIYQEEGSPQQQLSTNGELSVWP